MEAGSRPLAAPDNLMDGDPEEEEEEVEEEVEEEEEEEEEGSVREAGGRNNRTTRRKRKAKCSRLWSRQREKYIWRHKGSEGETEKRGGG
ncbi:hypothetical protein CesoFtcFv8_005567 [Champsocephalus esox]|uniref:Uncharacterized protein n=1 Tax=Champsocephalus esox TaxID=159716 RepID=A0AAN8CPN3_9TELE|nr:hypothetical protein CesoFtcFv8_005567 [Champsocephalus esox]